MERVISKTSVDIWNYLFATKDRNNLGLICLSLNVNNLEAERTQGILEEENLER